MLNEILNNRQKSKNEKSPKKSNWKMEGFCSYFVSNLFHSKDKGKHIRISVASMNFRVLKGSTIGTGRDSSVPAVVVTDDETGEVMASRRCTSLNWLDGEVWHGKRLTEPLHRQKYQRRKEKINIFWNFDRHCWMLWNLLFFF